MKRGIRLDSVGDVEVTVLQFEFVQVPILLNGDQSSMVKLKARKDTTGENFDSLVIPDKNLLTPRLLDHIAKFELEKNSYSVKNAEITRIDTLMNSHIPDFENILNDMLNMDLRNPDVRARVMDYFILLTR
ncbi:hypothetical protein PsorP6_015072 [Peronosclerospora sorghi]|uniref:Uncharacterized protein n=1 Tax=Peronosclerospora sorghi TaxID=230839 RepID=A0ACC0VT97_9STRA|nr:hypothetical protein PsorP6_015072 [Peronosclerospora sorghi]